MQYKTVTVEHPKGLGKMAVQKVNDEYQQILNEQALLGWKLLGIHTIDIRRRVGCLGRMWRLFWAVLGDSESEDFFQADVLVFFREGDSGQVMDYPPEDTVQRYNNTSASPEEESQTPKKTMQERTMSVVSNVSSKVSGLASNAAEFLNSEETAQKMMDIKKKAASAMDAVSSKASGISESAREKMENETEKSDDESENS